MVRWSRDIIVTCVLFPAILALLNVSPAWMVGAALISLAALKAWENKDDIRAHISLLSRQRKRVAVAGLVLIALAAIGGFEGIKYWQSLGPDHYTWQIPSNHNLNMPRMKPLSLQDFGEPRLLTLRKLFDFDFDRFFRTNDNVDIKDKRGNLIGRAVFRVMIDLSTGTKFVGLYVPYQQSTFRICK
jgi:hypothetical protein